VTCSNFDVTLIMQVT